MDRPRVHLEITFGPNLARIIRLTRIAEAALELIPEWHAQERARLQSQLKRLLEELERANPPPARSQ